MEADPETLAREEAEELLVNWKDLQSSCAHGVSWPDHLVIECPQIRMLLVVDGVFKFSKVKRC